MKEVWYEAGHGYLEYRLKTIRTKIASELKKNNVSKKPRLDKPNGSTTQHQPAVEETPVVEGDEQMLKEIVSVLLVVKFSRYWLCFVVDITCKM